MPGTYGTPNRQPVFTQAPILNSISFNPPVINDNWRVSDGGFGTTPQLVYTGQSAEGDLIDRITISATGDTSNTTVNAKLVYVYMRWYNAASPIWSLYKTLVMPATSITDIRPNPELELVFTGGLIINQNDRIYIGASTNYSNTSQYGDYLSVTIEGGRYTLNP
jgi:hypothetical protein